MKYKIPIALSPCPNDTYLFHAWITGAISTLVEPIPFYADIDHLNNSAKKGIYALIKLSFPQLQHLQHLYQLLSIGSAIGFNAGPKLVSKKIHSLHGLRNKKIAIPGRMTTANALLEHFFKEKFEPHFCLYHEVIPLLEKNLVDAGLIIHESRFTLKNYKLIELADFGDLWQSKYQLPLPLGGLAIKKDLSFSLKKEIFYALKTSLKQARLNPLLSQNYILHHSQEKDVNVVAQHIATYVTSETESLSKQGITAIDTLLNNATLTKERFLAD